MGTVDDATGKEDEQLKAQQVIAELERLHPEIAWSLYPLGDYDQVAELDAPDLLVSFGSEAQQLEEGLVDAFSTITGEACEPSHWGISVDAALILQSHNRVFIAKYRNCDGPKYLASKQKSD